MHFVSVILDLMMLVCFLMPMGSRSPTLVGKFVEISMNARIALRVTVFGVGQSAQIRRVRSVVLAYRDGLALVWLEVVAT